MYLPSQGSSCPAGERKRVNETMADVKKILVFPAGTEIAMEIYHALRFSKFVKLYGASSVNCHADFVFEPCIGGFPYVNDDRLIDYMNAVADEYGIDYIYPAHDSALFQLTMQQERLHAKVVTSDKTTVDICRSKKKTYEYLSGAYYLPQTFPDAGSVPSYPVFIKPSVGQGSEGARRIDDREHLDEALADGVEYAICEYLPGREFTVDCFTDRYGRLRVASPRTRDRIRAGISVRSEKMPCDEAVKAIAEDINSRFSFNGAWFFQLKQNSAGEYRLMEIAPRIAGTMALTRNLGINMPMLTLFNTWGYDVDIINNGNSELLDRAFISRYKTDIRYENVYVDYDDCLVNKGRVNGYLIMFLYQARDDGKRIYLLTKHDGSVEEALAEHGISEKLFTEIIHIPRGTEKAPYIKPESVFIDDSFAERKAVSDSCNIPVFDLDMVESLLDWHA